MLDPLLAAALDTSSDGAPLILVFTTGLTALGVVLGAAFAPLGDIFARRDQLKGYKRNIYRNFLDHGYWFLHGESYGDFTEAKRRERARDYIADWHRIRLITKDPDVLRLTDDIREPERFTDQRARELLEAFAREIGTGGLQGP